MCNPFAVKNLRACRLTGVASWLIYPEERRFLYFSALLLYPLKHGKPEHHLLSATYAIKVLVVPLSMGLICSQ